MAKKITINGAGIAGLSAECYLPLNGVDAEIYELFSLPGGLGTSWNRKEYTIDGCIRLAGSTPKNDFFHPWNELLNMESPSLETANFGEYNRVEDKNGNFISVRSNLDEFKRELLAKAPEDKELILELIEAANKLLELKISAQKAPGTHTRLDSLTRMFEIMPFIPLFKKWSSISAADLANQCKNPLLANVFRFMFAPEMSALFVILTLVWMHKKCAGYREMAKN